MGLMENRQFIRSLVRCGTAVSYQDRPQSPSQLVSPFVGAITGLDWELNVPMVSNWVALWNADYLVIIVGGVRDNAMTAATVAGWSVTVELERTQGWNWFAEGIARRILDRPAIKQLAFDRGVYFAGHSLGSMVVQSMADITLRERGVTIDGLISTGGPRPLNKRFGGNYADVPTLRFMLVDDPFPTLPPRFSEQPSTWLLGLGLTLPVSQFELYQVFSGRPTEPAFDLWPGFAHSDGGMIVDLLGNTISQADPPPAPSWAVFAGNLADLIRQGNGAQNHDILAYDNALTLWAQDGSSKLNGSIGGEAGEGAGWDIDPSLILPTDRTFTYFLPFGEGIPPMAFNNNIDTSDVPNPTGPPKGALYLRGELLATYPTQGRARTAAKHLNKFLRTLGKADEVSASGTVSGMSAYLATASQGNGVERRPVTVVS